MRQPVLLDLWSESVRDKTGATTSRKHAYDPDQFTHVFCAAPAKV